MILTVSFVFQEEVEKKEAQEKERRQRAEEKFKEWLASAHDKSQPCPKTAGCSRGKKTLLFKIEKTFCHTTIKLHTNKTKLCDTITPTDILFF